MSADRRQSPERGDGVGPPASFAGRGRRSRGAAEEAPELDRLPPPAFPPGSRRLPLAREPRPRTVEGAGDGGEAAAIPDEAFIAPDEPIVRTADLDGAAFISPDEPLPPRKPADEADPEEVVVTGIGDDSHLHEAPEPEPAWDDPHVAVLVEQVGQLADALRERGEAGLRTTADMSGFEATLRAYCVGWLAARRERANDG